MPRSTTTAANCRNANAKSRKKKSSDPDIDPLQDNLDLMNENGDQEAKFNKSPNVQNLVAVWQNLDQKSKAPSAGHSSLFKSRKLALYNATRKRAREIVNFSTNTLEGSLSILSDMRTQETGFHKYREDCQIVISSNKDSFDRLVALYSSIYQDLGKSRAETLEGASTMLKNNASLRYELLKEVSKRARQQLENAKQDEKIAEDAGKLIERFKRLIHDAHNG